MFVYCYVFTLIKVLKNAEQAACIQINHVSSNLYLNRDGLIILVIVKAKPMNFNRKSYEFRGYVAFRVQLTSELEQNVEKLFKLLIHLMFTRNFHTNFNRKMLKMKADEHLPYR